jgi:predicted 3-demethylubiquinone-9 3-methyltransferase (glyoxalase superfamily)
MSAPERVPATGQRITTFLWFDNQAEEAAKYYASIFRNSRVGDIARYGKSGPGPEGSVMTIEFTLDGQDFVALNGGPEFKFTEAISLVVNCANQEEVDYYWDKLSAGGQEVQCGWVKDKYGLSWQVTPTILMEMLKDKDPERRERVMNTMMKMVKLDIAPIQKAYDGK